MNEIEKRLEKLEGHRDQHREWLLALDARVENCENMLYALQEGLAAVEAAMWRLGK